MKKKWFIMAVCLAVPLAVGFLSGFLTRGESDSTWYHQLEKPWFQPPSWVFGPVWTTLYLLMGVSLYLVYTAPASRMQRLALVAFGVQLVLNFFWSIIFFRFHAVGLAAVEIVLLLGAILWMAVLFFKVRRVAAYLQLPYVAWTMFATILTITIYWLNRT